MKKNQLSLIAKLKTFTFFAILSLVLTGAAASAFAADGDLDASFGGSGIVNDNFGGSFGIFTRSVKIQPDGKILTGSAVLGADFANYDFGVLRYNTNGTLDTSFGTGGRQIVDVNGGSETLPTILLQADGKIIVVGQNITTAPSGRGIILTRLNSNGSFDNSFGTNGKVTTNFISTGKVAANLQADGKIVVVGNWSGSSFSTARFNADGTLDNSFGIGGVVQNNVTGNTGVSYAVAFQTDGKIIIGGLISDGSPGNLGDFVVFRYTASGAVDTTFGGIGYVRVDFSSQRDAAQSLVIQPDGKIIAAGLATVATNIGNVFGIVRFNSDGSPDASFGTAGKVSALPVNAFIDQINDRYPTLLQPDGKIVVGRTRFINNNANDGKQSNIARFNANGTLDTTFGAGGQIATTQNATLGDLALQTDGKIVAAGGGLNNGSTVTARYLNTAGVATINNPTLRFADFDGDTKTDISVFRNGTWFINPSGSPSFVSAPGAAFGTQFGQAGDVTVPADYDGDGKSDIAVWRAGNLAYFYILNSSNNTFRAVQFGRTGDNPTVAGDWDADGKADLAVYRSGTQSFFYYRPSSASSVDFVPIQWGTSEDAPIFGDFDGDRKLDAAIYRPSQNTFYVRRSSDGTLQAKQWGNANTDAIFAGDFDGDGASDFAVQRFSGANAGTWYVAQSGGTNRAFQWGLGSDLPVPADYDGDGKMDFAVYRRSNGTWYIYQSATNSLRATTFGVTSDLPLPLNLVR